MKRGYNPPPPSVTGYYKVEIIAFRCFVCTLYSITCTGTLYSTLLHKRYIQVAPLKESAFLNCYATLYGTEEDNTCTLYSTLYRDALLKTGTRYPVWQDTGYQCCRYGSESKLDTHNFKINAFFLPVSLFLYSFCKKMFYKE